ncbi:QueT transporter family protein [Ruminococcus sp.]|uniref:QueT transporter family protein n=1 Tax=Ruminococcus sp. TaxID=41978 RepID=UPI002E790111|nr:QueT transporter family protein [Ruminococcus sp.]MEE1262890.1 QueT transporter family protein [Ruminococcus sp.]
MKNKSVYFLTQTSIIAALYAVLTILQATLFPESTSAAIKFRASEALTVLALFTPAAVPGLTLGCVLANLSSFAVLGPLDMIFGSVASLLAAVTMYLLRNARLFSLPVFACLMPALFNGLIVGFEIAFFFTDGGFTLTGFLFSGGFVAIGELAVLFVLGLPLSVFLEKSKLSKKLFIKR